MLIIDLFIVRHSSVPRNITAECNTVDGFQGQEKDIIIISCVRNTPNSFLSDPKRMNVALTRAKHVLYIIGNNQLFWVSQSVQIYMNRLFQIMCHTWEAFLLLEQRKVYIILVVPL